MSRSVTLLLSLVVVEADAGNGVADGLVPGELAFADEHACGSSGEQLGVGSNLAKGVGREGQFFVVVAIAVAFGEDQLVIDNDADADAGRVPVLEGLLHPGVEALEFGVDVLGLRVQERAEDRGEKQREAEEPQGAKRAVRFE
jgi:hypothetical protein